MFLLLFPVALVAQEYNQVFRGIVTDVESHKPLSQVNILCKTCKVPVGCLSDSLGRFRLQVPLGRHSFEVTHLGYNSKTVSDIQFGAGKEVYVAVEMSEKIYQSEEIAVHGQTRQWINQMATVSARTLRSQDAAHYAGGYFDAARMVSNFPGVASGGSDNSNEIVIRGNSPRGVLWRLEGIEIPNPNHFSSGQGSSGGGFSIITTNVLSGFDFFTGSFPAEYGNAFSGVFDLNLRNGNAEKREYSLGLSVLGAEFSGEGPVGKKSGSSFLIDARLADFSFLTKLHVIDPDELSMPPKTKDWVFKTSLRTGKFGTVDLFSIGGESSVGDAAVSTKEAILQGGDIDQSDEHHSMTASGIKHLILLPNTKTYVRTTVAFTTEFNSNQESSLDTLMHLTKTYYERFRYPAVRWASQINHKFNASHSLRLGFSVNKYLPSNMFAIRLNSKMQYDTLLADHDKGWYANYYLQWKYKSPRLLETNAGINVMHSGINQEVVVEPRLGLALNLPCHQSLRLGAGFHSRVEPLSVYAYRIKTTGNKREAVNRNLETTKAFHLTGGYSKDFGGGFLFTMEAYWQFLYDIPGSKNIKSQYSVVNILHGIPELALANNTRGKNKGLELTLEKSFSKNYFFLLTASLYNSKYKAPDGIWYNSFFNTNYVYNAVGGKEFPVGKHRQNAIGITLRGMSRGGFRYTPVNEAQSLKSKKLVYQASLTNGLRLPAYKRIDFGLNYKLNKSRHAWIFQADIQNLFDTRNVLRRKYQYINKKVLTLDSYSLGFIPVATVKVEF